ARGALGRRDAARKGERGPVARHLAPDEDAQLLTVRSDGQAYVRARVPPLRGDRAGELGDAGRLDPRERWLSFGGRHHVQDERVVVDGDRAHGRAIRGPVVRALLNRKSTRLNSSHVKISYA